MIKKILLGTIILMSIMSCSKNKYNESSLSNFKEEVKAIKKEKSKKDSFFGDSIPTVIGILDKSFYKEPEIYLYEYGRSNELLGLQEAIVKDGFFYFPDSIVSVQNMGEPNRFENEPLVLVVEIRDPNNPRFVDFYLEKGKKVEIFANVRQFTVLGGELNKKRNEFIEKDTKLYSEFMKVNEEYNTTTNENKKEKLFDQRNKLFKKRINLIYSFIKENINNLLGQSSIESWIGSLEPGQLEELVELIPDGTFKETVSYRRLKEIVEGKKNSAVGNYYANLEGINPDGNEISLKEYVDNNKLTLIEFWDSSCHGCIESLPKVKEIYDEFHKKGLEIVGVSTEPDKEFWENSIKENDLQWPQILGDSELANFVFKNYGITNTPYLILINQEGKIVEKGIPITELRPVLEQILK